MSDWKPIETAPKDGTHVLAYSPHEGQYVCWWGQWNMWQNNEVSEMDGDIIDQSPTHWMPLGDPPQQPHEKQKGDSDE